MVDKCWDCAAVGFSGLKVVFTQRLVHISISLISAVDNNSPELPAVNKTQLPNRALPPAEYYVSGVILTLLFTRAVFMLPALGFGRSVPRTVVGTCHFFGGLSSSVSSSEGNESTSALKRPNYHSG